MRRVRERRSGRNGAQGAQGGSKLGIGGVECFSYIRLLAEADAVQDVRY